MSKTLHPYYLQQMGIETWVVRQPLTQSIKLMIIGDALDDDKQAMSLFNKMLASIGLTSEDVSISGILSDALKQKIITHPPQLLLAIGNAAIKSLNKEIQPLYTLRSKTHHYHGVPLIVSYHPADLLQHPADKKFAYQDLLRIQHILTQSAC